MKYTGRRGNDFNVYAYHSPAGATASRAHLGGGSPTLVSLPGPETAIFDWYAPCTSIQKRHRKPIYTGKR
jgi:hypothetical protein